MSTAASAAAGERAPADSPDAPSSQLGSIAYRSAIGQRARSPRGAATPADAFRAARRTYLAGQRMDMRALANELGISRATLYRWTGPREQLLGDVAFSLSDAIFERAKRDTTELWGPDRLLSVFRRHVGALVGARPLQAFLHNETHLALRILTARGGPVHPRTVARLADLYRDEQRAGSFHPRADPGTLAYAVVRVTEGFIYNDAIVSVEPAVDQAASIVSLLLEPDSSRQASGAVAPEARSTGAT